MAKINIYYFSGTGNSAYVIDSVASELENLGNDVHVSSCEKTTDIDVDCDMIGLAFPIHTSKAPKVMSTFIDCLPAVENIDLFGIVTSSSVAGDILHHELDGLKNKGYRPFFYKNIVVANNLHLPRLSPLKVTSQKALETKLPKISEKTKGIAQDIHNKKQQLSGKDIFSKVFGISQRTVGKLHEKHNFMGFDTDSNCIKCMWCVRNCPTNNIKFENGKIKFMDNCILCMRCYNFCPKEAIQVTSKTQDNEKYKRYKGPLGKANRTRFR